MFSLRSLIVHHLPWNPPVWPHANLITTQSHKQHKARKPGGSPIVEGTHIKKKQEANKCMGTFFEPCIFLNGLIPKQFCCVLFSFVNDRFYPYHSGLL